MFTGSPELELVVVTVIGFINYSPFFHPPGSHTVILDNRLTALCTHINPSLLSNFILLGDFNINYLNTSHPLFSKLLSVSNSLSLTQVVSVLTH